MLAADYVDYRAPAFVAWLTDIRTKTLGGHGTWSSLRFTAMDSSNNWGTFASASVLVADSYLNDTGAINADWTRFQGFAGDRSAYIYRTPTIAQSSWRCVTAWTPIQLCAGDPRDGAVTEDAWRAGAYPTVDKLYVQEGLQGLGLMAEVFTNHHGVDAWPLLRRAADFATRQGVWNASSPGYHSPWLYNDGLDIGAPTRAAGFGRGFGYTDWLLGP